MFKGLSTSTIICLIIVVIILVLIIIRLTTNEGKLMEENYRYNELKDKVCNEMCIPLKNRYYDGCRSRTYGQNDNEYCLNYAIKRVLDNDRNNLCKIYECKI
jgi:hypothetical protein